MEVRKIWNCHWWNESIHIHSSESQTEKYEMQSVYKIQYIFNWTAISYIQGVHVIRAPKDINISVNVYVYDTFPARSRHVYDIRLRYFYDTFTISLRYVNDTVTIFYYTFTIRSRYVYATFTMRLQYVCKTCTICAWYCNEYLHLVTKYNEENIKHSTTAHDSDTEEGSVSGSGSKPVRKKLWKKTPAVAETPFGPLPFLQPSANRIGLLPIPSPGATLGAVSQVA